MPTLKPMLSAATAVQGRVVVGARTVLREGSTLFLFGVVPLCYAALFAVYLVHGNKPFDFHTFWWSGHDVLHGRSPYPATLPEAAHQKTFRPFVYPAPAAYAMAPLSLLPYGIANLLFAFVGVAAIAGALYLLDVHDWRCYGAVFAWPAVWSSLLNGAISSLLVLGCAALWRYRSRSFAAGSLCAALIVFKLYLWPLGLFLLATRRFRAAGAAAAVTVVATLGTWALLSFAGLRQYPALLDRLTSLVADQSYSPYALFRAAGASAGSARLLMLVSGGLLLGGIVLSGRRPANERAAFIVAVVASLALTPIVWPHYLALLIVVVALARPTLHTTWVLPMALWMAMPSWSGGNPARIAATLALCVAVATWCVRSVLRGGPLPLRRTAPLFGFGLQR
jgi:Glycosyltransferase family 87